MLITCEENLIGIETPVPLSKYNEYIYQAPRPYLPDLIGKEIA